jgi:hypothetical protein
MIFLTIWGVTRTSRRVREREEFGVERETYPELVMGIVELSPTVT